MSILRNRLTHPPKHLVIPTLGFAVAMLGMLMAAAASLGGSERMLEVGRVIVIVGIGLGFVGVAAAFVWMLVRGLVQLRRSQSDGE